MHGDGGVAEHRLRTRRGDDDVAGAILERIAQVPQVAFLLLALHFEVGQRGEQHRVPVDEPLAAIDQPFVVAAARRPR